MNPGLALVCDVFVWNKSAPVVLLKVFAPSASDWNKRKLNCFFKDILYIGYLNKTKYFSPEPGDYIFLYITLDSLRHWASYTVENMKFLHRLEQHRRLKPGGIKNRQVDTLFRVPSKEPPLYAGLLRVPKSWTLFIFLLGCFIPADFRNLFQVNGPPWRWFAYTASFLCEP